MRRAWPWLPRIYLWCVIICYEGTCTAQTVSYTTRHSDFYMHLNRLSSSWDCQQLSDCRFTAPWHHLSGYMCKCVVPNSFRPQYVKFHKTWNGHHAITLHLAFIRFNFMWSVISVYRPCKVLRSSETSFDVGSSNLVATYMFKKYADLLFPRFMVNMAFLHLCYMTRRRGNNIKMELEADCKVVNLIMASGRRFC
jgi:hypothetical protein